MRVRAPGKLVLTGAYAVLEGAPAVVVAVDRYATADVSAPETIDTRALHDASGRKLGLGSSAAARVVAEAARAVAAGGSLTDAAERERIFALARKAHAVEQGGGSGVDVAAAVHGGVLRYRLEGVTPVVTRASLPAGLAFTAFWSGTSARTSDLRARVDAVPPATRAATFTPLHVASRGADAALAAGDLRTFVAAARAFGRALDALGRVADAPIVPPAFAELASLASGEDAAFHPAGAGGGDVAVWLGPHLPSPAFVARAEALGMSRLDLGLDTGGVSLDSSSAG